MAIDIEWRRPKYMAPVKGHKSVGQSELGYTCEAHYAGYCGRGYGDTPAEAKSDAARKLIAAMNEPGIAGYDPSHR